MIDKEYILLKKFLLFHIKANIYFLDQLQWEDLFIVIQDLFILNEPKKRIHEYMLRTGRPELNPDIKKFVDETNRRLNK